MKPAAREWQTRHSERAGNRQICSRRPLGSAASGTSNSCGPAGGRDQLRVSLLGVPAVGVPGPFSLLADEQPSFDSLARWIAGVADSNQSQSLDQNRSVGQRPRSAGVELGLLLDPLQARQRGEMLESRPVGPLRSTDLKAKRGRMRLVVGDRGEQPGLAQPASGMAGKADRLRSSARDDKTHCPDR